MVAPTSQENIISCVNESDGRIQVEFKQKNLRYIDEFLLLSCTPDMMENKLYPNAKEITESFAAYDAVRKYMWPRINPSDTNVVLVAVGDGRTPRTGGMFAYRTRWTCHSVDPVIKKYAGPMIARLTCWPCKIEELDAKAFGITSETTVIVIAVHSHADLAKSIEAVLPCKEVNVVAIPCCFSQVLEHQLTDMYHDWGIHSPHRLVKVWTKITGGKSES